MINRSQFRLAERARQVGMTVERELCCFGVERLAIVKRDAWPQFNGDRLTVGGRRMRECELRYDIEVLLDVEQLVAERRKDDTTDICTGERRIEHIRVYSQADA